MLVAAPGMWVVTTENVRRLGFAPLPASRNISLPTSQITIDGATLQFTSASPLPQLPSATLCKLNGIWQICNDNGAWMQTERNPSNYGPLRQVIEGPVVIVYGTQVFEDLFITTGLINFGTVGKRVILFERGNLASKRFVPHW